MRWLSLYNKIGKQYIKTMRETDIVAVIDNEEIPLRLVFTEEGKPYFKPELAFIRYEKVSNTREADE